MQLSQSIRLKQKQSMVMTPRLQQAIRMLQMNNLDLASYLEDQALENPFLEVAANSAEARKQAAMMRLTPPRRIPHKPKPPAPLIQT